MAKRLRLDDSVDEGKDYYSPSSSPFADTFSSGCSLLDSAIGGGWAESRMINLVGDRSTGKTLLAIEACANFARKYRERSNRIYYRETEAAFDEPYAASVGLPLDRVSLSRDLGTVEDLFEDIDKVIKKTKEPSLYVVDSLDALSDRAEQKRGIDEGTFGGNKAKQLSQLFRRHNKKMSSAGITFIIVSQLRDKIGVTFGERQTRAGGRALDFYASQIVWLAHLKRITKERGKVKRAVGVQIKAQVKKNKIGPPFREVEFPILFSYGIDDITAACDWLKSINADPPSDGSWKSYAQAFAGCDREEFARRRRRLSKIVKREWRRLEDLFLPTRSKYDE